MEILLFFALITMCNTFTCCWSPYRVDCGYARMSRHIFMLNWNRTISIMLYITILCDNTKAGATHTRTDARKNITLRQIYSCSSCRTFTAVHDVSEIAKYPQLPHLNQNKHRSNSEKMKCRQIDLQAISTHFFILKLNIQIIA